MTSNKLNKVIISVFLIFSFITIPVFSEEVIDYDLNFSLDIPEGFIVSDYTQDGSSILFEHSNAPISLILKTFQKSEFTSSENALQVTLQKLNAKGETDSFTWSRRKCSITTFEMTLDKKYSGWGISAPVEDGNSYLVCLCYAPSENAAAYNQFIISTLNSLCIDKAFYYVPGIITSYAYPLEGSKNVNLKIGSTTVKTFIDKVDSEASQFVVDMEFGVLTLYANHPMKMDAWKRFYRMIYRDNFGRLAKAREDIHEIIYAQAEKKNSSNPDLEYAATLLSWVQNFEYKRDNQSKSSSDFTALPSVLEGNGNDCDSRSMLLCVLMNDIGVDSVLLFSPQFSHALGGFDLNASGQKYDVEMEDKKISYIMGETTAKVTLGMIAQDHADRSKWFYVKF